jgi:hypothetical protein
MPESAWTVVPEWLRTILGWFFWTPGEPLDGFWGIITVVYTAVVAVVLVVLGVRAVGEHFKALDFRYNKQRVAKYNTEHPDDQVTIDWAKAYKQLVCSWRFSIPFGILLLASLAYWLVFDFTLLGYARVGVVWLLFQYPLRLWWIATATWSERKLIAKGELDIDDSQTYNWSVKQSVDYYFAWGLAKANRRRPSRFRQLMAWSNWIVWLFRLRWLQPRLALPVLLNTFWSLFWPVAKLWQLISLSKEFDKRGDLLEPWWASDSANKPPTGWVPMLKQPVDDESTDGPTVLAKS